MKNCCDDCGKEINYYKSKRCRDCWDKMSKVPWNKGKKVINTWNKGKTCPNIQKEKHYNWKGGKTGMGNGYIYILSPGHPKAKISHKNKRGYVAEHVLVMEKKLGRYLQGGECVHHIDCDKTNNKTSNLLLFHNMQEHLIACHSNRKHIKYGKYKGRFKGSH